MWTWILLNLAQFSYFLCMNKFLNEVEIFNFFKSAIWGFTFKPQCTICQSWAFYIQHSTPMYYLEVVFVSPLLCLSNSSLGALSFTSNPNSVASNSNIKNFEHLWIWQVGLRTHSNPGSNSWTKKPSQKSKLLTNKLNPYLPKFRKT